MHFLSNIGGVVDTSQLISLTSLLQGSFLYQINTPFDSMFQLYFYHIVWILELSNSRWETINHDMGTDSIEKIIPWLCNFNDQVFEVFFTLYLDWKWRVHVIIS